MYVTSSINHGINRLIITLSHSQVATSARTCQVERTSALKRQLFQTY